MNSRLNYALWGLIPAIMLIGGTNCLASDNTGATSLPGTPSTQLVWETDQKEMATKDDQLTADFSFAFTNKSDSEVVIEEVKTSCSCTVAKLPSQPWRIAAHTNGHVDATVDLRGKNGEFQKKLIVYFGGKDVQPKLLTISVKMPDKNQMRERNTKLALADRQAVFKGDCAKCHATPAKTATGMALYHEICGICHEAQPRASMVPDLRGISQHPTDVAFWKEMISSGKSNTLMPAFAASQGGPLTDEQIESMAKMLDAAYPYSRFAGQQTQSASPSRKN